MKLVIDIGGTKVLLTAEQMEELVTILVDADKIHSEWKSGSGNGHYVHSIKEINVREDLSLRVMPTREYEAMLAIQKINAP